MWDTGKRSNRALAAATLVFAAALSATQAGAEERRVKIINETNNTIVRFYASGVETASWEEDILGKDVLRPTQSVAIDIDDGTDNCLFDFKAVFDDGDEVVRKQIDVCKIEAYRYTAE